MENFLNKIKNNDYLKLYIRMLKEKKLYRMKTNKKQTEEEEYMYISKQRYKTYYSRRTIKPYKPNSLISNIELPNLLISDAINFSDFINIYNEYNRNITPYITKTIINKIIKQYNIKLTKKEKQNIIDNIINKIITTVFNDTDDKSNYFSTDELITKINNIYNQQLKCKIFFVDFKTIVFNTINSKWK